MGLLWSNRHGFWGIFLLAAWPNALFDLCGICCGHFLMPFWQFFGATLMGKAFVKVRTAHQLPYCLSCFLCDLVARQHRGWDGNID